MTARSDINVLILTNSDPRSDPRPQRMIRLCRDQYNTAVVSLAATGPEGVRMIPLPIPSRSSIPRRVAKAVLYKLRRFEHLLWPPAMAELGRRLQSDVFDLVISHDLSLLPLAVAAARPAGALLFDAREYYPRHFEDRWVWRFFYKRMNDHLCCTYLGACDHLITVSDGIAREYASHFGIRPDVIRSVPPFHEMVPSPVDPSAIRLVHHGFAHPSRRLELMIEMMRHTEPRFSLDLFLVAPGQARYLRRLRRLAEVTPRVRIRDPLPMPDLIPLTNAYDIGVFLVPPTTLNLQFALPNKFFEFIQARLAVAVGPSVEMAALARRHGVGIVADSFQPADLAAQLNQLSTDDLRLLKAHADTVARTLCFEQESRRLQAILDRLLNASPPAK